MSLIYRKGDQRKWPKHEIRVSSGAVAEVVLCVDRLLQLYQSETKTFRWRDSASNADTLQWTP